MIERAFDCLLIAESDVAPSGDERIEKYFILSRHKEGFNGVGTSWLSEMYGLNSTPLERSDMMNLAAAKTAVPTILKKLRTMSIVASPWFCLL